ncbi:hypothetical protein Tco_0758881 [Tanacetum coccineum]
MSVMLDEADAVNDTNIEEHVIISERWCKYTNAKREESISSKRNTHDHEDIHWVLIVSGPHHTVITLNPIYVFEVAGGGEELRWERANQFGERLSDGGRCGDGLRRIGELSAWG